MSGPYSTLADVVPFLPSGGLPNPARVATGSAAGDYLESDGHGLATNAEVTVRAEVGGSVPAPLVEGTTYYAIVLSPSRFQLAAAPNGSAINLTTDGVNFVYSSPLPWDAWIGWADRMVDSFLPPHVVPLVSPLPEVVVTSSAELAAMRGLQATSGAAVDIGPRIDAIGVRLARWAKTMPVRGVTVQTQQPVDLAVTESAGAVDPRGWAGADPTRIP